MVSQVLKDDLVGLPEPSDRSPHDPFVVLRHMQTAEAWHDGPRTALYQFGRHGKPGPARGGLELLTHYLKFYRKLLGETKECLKRNLQGFEEEARLSALKTYIERRLCEYQLLQRVEAAEQQAQALALVSVATRLKESARALSVELQFPL